MSMQLRADMMMILVTVSWGTSYVFMKMGLGSIEAFNLVALRFGIAFLFAGLLFYKRLIKVDLKTVKYGMILGFILYLVFTFITFGVKTTSASNAGFIVSLAVIFVPVLSALFLKQKIGPRVFTGIFLSLLGIGLLTLNPQLQMNPGDVLCMLGALSYATYILVTGSLTKNVDSLSLGIIQLGFVSLFGLISSFMAPETTVLPDTAGSWFAIISLGIFCSAIGFTIQTISQKYTTPTNTGLIFSLEPVFAAVFAFLVLDEKFTTNAYIGAALVLTGVLLSRIDVKRVFLKRGESV
ncbi:DMT family transporter [Salibacterium salarium]|uniref:DMT family transporter n=1 Tax=Salibacterium salarium TaxID=284579 RepID=A0A428MZV4_9BACI|nr:DMT family transporter [Salibacterium salarium]RSL31714.1 DMT family transporter [Salibacterium salarium]